MNIITNPSFWMRKIGKKRPVTAQQLKPSVKTMEKLYHKRKRENRFRREGFTRTKGGWIKVYGSAPNKKTPRGPLIRVKAREIATPDEVIAETLPDADRMPHHD